MTYKAHNILQLSFLRAELGPETFDFIHKVITLSFQIFFIFFLIHLGYAVHSGVGCIFDEIYVFYVVTEERDVVKKMSSDNMKFSDN